MNTEENVEVTGSFEDKVENKKPVIKKKLELDIDVNQHNSGYNKWVYGPDHTF